VSTNFGEPATITFPKGVKPATGVQVKVVKQGSGSPVAKGQVASFSYTMADWTTGKSLGSSYSQSVPEPVTSEIPNSQIPQAWNTAVQNQRVGSRVMLVAPASQVFSGGQGDQQDGIGKNDVLVFALDIASAFNGTADISGRQPTMTASKLPAVSVDPGQGAPKITIPSGVKPPTSLTCQTLIKGTGPTVRAGQNLTVQYDGVLWRDGKSFDSSFSRKQPTSFYIGVGGVVPGWDRTLVGQPVGSRLLLVLPPSAGYGSTGNAQAGIKGTDTLVFVVDILSAT
jgi:FKBP-type peptidyl-prolyl cis-trans isomerase